MIPEVLFVLVFVLVTSSVLVWGTYESLRATVEGRLRPRTVLALLAVGLLLLPIVVVAGDINYLWEIPDAVACADNAELIIEAIPGPRATLGKHVEGWDFLSCTVYWYVR
jgi:hypothetical protein